MKRVTLLFLTLSIIGNIMTSCVRDNDNNNEVPAVVIIAGLHSNSQEIELKKTEITKKIKRTYGDFGNLAVIVSDGVPTVERLDNGQILGFYNEAKKVEDKQIKKNNLKYWEKNILNGQTSGLQKKIMNLRPKENEVDLLAAIQEAQKCFEGYFPNQEGEKEIIIYDTGLSTEGKINFLHREWQELLFSNKKIERKSLIPILNKLKAESEIPDLSGIKVTWYGLGATAAPQPSLSQMNQDNLAIIWGEFLKMSNAVQPRTDETGGADGFFVAELSSQSSQEYDSKVTPIIDWSSIGNDQDDINTLILKGVVLTEEKVGFKEDSSEFISDASAKKVIEPYANSLLNQPEMRILLVGTTADPNRRGGSLSLSKERADKVKKCMVEFGVPDGQINVLAWGAQKPFYDEDEWKSGNFDFNYAQINRSVIILPYDSVIAQLLISS